MGRASQGALPSYVKRTTEETRARVRVNAKLVQRRRIGYDALKKPKPPKKKAPQPAAVSKRKPFGLYDVLELTPPATIDQVTKGYRRLAKVYHPDKHATASAQKRAAMTVKFRELQSARDVLGDAAKKRKYDASLCLDAPKSAEAPRRQLPRTAAMKAFRATQSVNDRAEDAAICRLRCQMKSDKPPMKSLLAMLTKPQQSVEPVLGALVRYPEKTRDGWKWFVGKWTRMNGIKKFRIVERGLAAHQLNKRLRSALVAVPREWMVGV